jgi:hypothetical protein
MLKKLARTVAIVGLFLVPLLVIYYGSDPTSKDYISYWSAGQLLTHHGDPYSPSSVLAVEKQQGYAPEKPIIMRNPPWALFLTIPLGYVNARWGLIPWTAAILACLIAYFRLMRVAPRDRIIVYLFAPVLACLSSGQSSPFLLLGFSLFLRFHQRQPRIGAIGLLLMAIKPHLFLVFGPILLIDCIYRENYRLLSWSAVSLAGATFLGMSFDPHVWPHYLAMLRSSNLNNEFIQTPSYLFRYLVSPSSEWLQFLPSIAALIWGVWFYLRNRDTWDWCKQGMPLMLITVFTSPYAWLTDEIVLLPTIVFALSNPHRPRQSENVYILLNVFAMALIVAQVQLSSGAYLWTTAAWVGWYLYSRHPSGNQLVVQES